MKQNVPFINEMKHMEVCPVCGAFLVVNDTQTRVDAHLSGKQHVGYALIREAIKELKVRFYLHTIIALMKYQISHYFILSESVKIAAVHADKFCQNGFAD